MRKFEQSNYRMARFVPVRKAWATANAGNRDFLRGFISASLQQGSMRKWHGTR